MVNVLLLDKLITTFATLYPTDWDLIINTLTYRSFKHSNKICPKLGHM